jgi:hypothetical protein
MALSGTNRAGPWLAGGGFVLLPSELFARSTMGVISNHHTTFRSGGL